MNRVVLVLLSCACGTASIEPDDGGHDASDATVMHDSGPCGEGADGGCGCGQPPPTYDANETLAADLALFDGSAPDGACPPLTFGVPWDGGAIQGAILFRGCKNTTIFVTSSCADPQLEDGIKDFLVFDLQGKIIGATQMSGLSCNSTGIPPDYVPCGADASYPFECQVLCGCDTWQCHPFDDAGASDASSDG